MHLNFYCSYTSPTPVGSNFVSAKFGFYTTPFIDPDQVYFQGVHCYLTDAGDRSELIRSSGMVDKVEYPQNHYISASI